MARMKDLYITIFDDLEDITEIDFLELQDAYQDDPDAFTNYLIMFKEKHPHPLFDPIIDILQGHYETKAVNDYLITNDLL